MYMLRIIGIAVIGFMIGAQEGALATTKTSAQKSTARKPDISEGAKPCSIEKVSRPFVLTTANRLDEIKREIAKGAGSQYEYFTRILKPHADKWSTRTIAIPPRSGHYHHFVCTDGTRLIDRGEDHIGEYGPYKCPACGKTYEGDRFDGGKRNLEHIWIVQACRNLSLMYGLTGEQRYARKSAEILRKIADAYPGRHTSNVAGGLWYQSLDESMKTIELAQAYDLIHDSNALTDTDRDHIEQDLFWEAAAGLRHVGMGGNWGSWHLSAIGVIGLATKHQANIDFATKQFKRQIKDELGDDGLWPESVHTYHFFPLLGFLSFAEAAANTGTDLYTYEPKPGKSLTHMLLTPIQYMYPSMRLPAINDGWFHSLMPNDQYEIGYARTQSPEIAALLKRMYTESFRGAAGQATVDDTWSFIAHKQMPDTVPPLKLKSINFPVLGIAALKTDAPPEKQKMVTLDYGRFLGHGQLDKMGFTLFAHNRLICADYGTPSYGSEMLPFYTGTTGHNTIVVDGKNQQRTTESQLLAFEDAPFAKVACARSREAYPGVDWRRTVVLTDDYALIVDDLVSSQPHQYDWLMRVEGETVTADGTSSGSGELKYRYISPTGAYDLGSCRTVSCETADGSGLDMMPAVLGPVHC